MRTVAYFLVSLSIYIQLASSNNALDQKVWSVCSKNGSCSCGPNIYNAVQCTEGNEFLRIQNCYCMYYDEQQNMSFLGTCLISCNNQAHPSSLFYFVERNVSFFNDAICSNASTTVNTFREGRFCGRCKSNYGLAAYSYHYTSCIECTDHGYMNWLKYFAVALLPLTLFIFLVVVFKINVPSSHLNGIVFMMQCLTSPPLMRVYDGALRPQLDQGYQIATVRAIYVIFGIFNLDFLRDVYSPFCLHPFSP